VLKRVTVHVRILSMFSRIQNDWSAVGNGYYKPEEKSFQQKHLTGMVNSLAYMTTFVPVL
jgi:hypothetical protein